MGTSSASTPVTGTRDDIEDLMRARAVLRSQGFAEELGY